MDDNSKRLVQLLIRMDDLMKREELFRREIQEVRKEIYLIKASEESKKVAAQQNMQVNEPNQEERMMDETVIPISDFPAKPRGVTAEKPEYSFPKAAKPSRINRDLEKFIGENLINKIGIAVTIIGVAIGVKYSIDHQLISPLTRILLGYLLGFILLGLGFRLRKEYDNYSAVLSSGGMTIMYFITYAAFSFFHLMPHFLAFGLMVLFTFFTVYLALSYNKQVIAHIGLVGAYAVPFLLSENSGNVTILYSYTTIINIGILIISFLKYWKPLYYSSFSLTWLMFLFWFASSYRDSEHFELALIFSSIFFLIFYASFLVYKLRKNRIFETEDIFLLLTNAFIFYGFGYSILSQHTDGKQLLGLFTVANAMIHFAVSLIIYRQKLADKNLFYLVFGLVLLFVTIAIPVQLDGNWVTLLWAGEAVLLFWIGRTKATAIYEFLSYPVMFLAFFSLLQDWGTGPYFSQPQVKITPIFNINFLTSALFLASFGTITYLNQNQKYSPPKSLKENFVKILAVSIPAVFLFTLYYSFRIEIASHFQQVINLHSGNQLLSESETQLRTAGLLKFKDVWISNYSMLFLSLVSLVNIGKLKNQMLGFANLGFNAIAIAVFLIEDLYIFGEFRETYLQSFISSGVHKDFIYIGIRYISMVLAALLIFSTYKYTRQKFLKKDFHIEFDLLLYISILWIASSELIYWLDFLGSSHSYKLGLSIFWGVYSMLLISLGIWKKKKHLRIGAIVLFAATLLKLFFYDISYLDTISKTIVFVSLGILLLGISFLYNKYKNIIF